MSNDEFSSVEWLVEQIKKDINLRLRGFDIDKALEQAKAMHKEEMINFTTDWYHNGLLSLGVLVSTSVEEHYNKTFDQ